MAQLRIDRETREATIWLDPADPLRMFATQLQSCPVCTVPLVAAVQRVTFSRMGDFSCPVSCGALLLLVTGSGFVALTSALFVCGVTGLSVYARTGAQTIPSKNAMPAIGLRTMNLPKRENNDFIDQTPLIGMRWDSPML